MARSLTQFGGGSLSFSISPKLASLLTEMALEQGVGSRTQILRRAIAVYRYLLRMNRTHEIILRARDNRQSEIRLHLAPGRTSSKESALPQTPNGTDVSNGVEEPTP